MKLGRFYSVVVEEAALTAATDLLRIVAPSTAIVIVHEVRVTFGASAQDNFAIQCHGATGGGTVTAVTPKAHQAGSTAYGGTAYDLTGDTDTTESGIPHDRQEGDVRAGYWWTPKEPVVISPSGIFAVRSDIAVTSTSATAVVIIEEIGT